MSIWLPTLGYLADRLGAAKVLIATFPIAAVLYFILGQNVNNVDVWWMVAPFAGAFAIGGIMALAPFAADLYPTSVRGTGVGSALGVGRVGSIITPPLGKVLLAGGVGVVGFYNVAMIAPIVASLVLKWASGLNYERLLIRPYKLFGRKKN